MSSPPRSGRAARPISSRTVRAFVGVGVALAVIHSFELLGEASESAMPVLTVLTLVALVTGVRRNRPAQPGPWLLFIPSAVLFAVGSLVRESVSSTGNLTSHRNILPELFSLPGYLCLLAGLLWLLKLRAQQQHHPGVAADATLLALGSFVASWTYLIDPVFSTREAAPIAIVAISVYPMLSAFSVSIAARLAFGPGERNVSHRLLVAGMGALVIGDVAWFLTDAGVIDPPSKIVDLPYGLTYALIAAAQLHPSMRDVSQPLTVQRGHLQRSRVALVGLALLSPALVLPFWSPSNVLERLLVPALLAGMVAVAIARLVSSAQAQSRSEARFAHLATHDQLTGLPNRLLVYDFIESAVRSAPGGRSIAVVFLDIDRFRLVNDSLGHMTGDRLLRAVAARLQLVTRPGDLVSRISGDEFLVVALDVDAEDAVALGERLRAAFDRGLDIGHEHHITVSAGVAWANATAGGNWAADLTRDADTAMYRSKDRGGNAVTIFGEAMRDEVARRLSIESQLRRALDEGEMEVHYQPIVSLATGTIEGFEALARWRRGDDWITPVEFVPVAEESGLIIPLGAWIMTEACSQLARWRGLTGCADLTMSVNVSPRQLRTSDVVAMVHRALEDAGLDGHALWFEITESSMMLDTSDTVETLAALHEQGVRVCVDDFGTGFSSLSYLQKFAIDRLKIDRSFVVAMEQGDESKSLVSAILAIARTLDIDVVAEGIETRVQAETLFALGCRGAQGFLFGRPSPGPTIEALLVGESPSAAGAVPRDARAGDGTRRANAPLA
jgi:diguanylate cyclase (GGDEF)-like protein